MTSAVTPPPSAMGNLPQGTTAAVRWSREDLEASVVERFERIARAVPENTALIGPDRRWSYADLQSASNRIAHELLDRIGGEHEPVALLLKPGFDFFAAYLAIMKSGNICLPLDTTQPVRRLETILRQNAPKLILRDEQQSDWRRMIELDAPIESVNELQSGRLDTIPVRTVSASDPAGLYITSGSTGTPKAVLRDHRNMLHHVMTYSNDQRIDEDDRQSFLYSVQSGASMPDLLGALLNGAQLHLFELKLHGIGELLRWVRSAGITLIHMPVPLFRLLIDANEGRSTLAELRAILVGGEAVFRMDLERAWTVLGEQCRIIHQLSSTETNYITRFNIDRRTPVDSLVVPVGYAARDKEVIIMDENGQPAPSGVVGEIVVRSRFMARGYWKDDELTRQKFEPDPIEPDLVTYHTGDLGRMDDQGLLRYVGRTDQQIRVRGFRVEIAEIEAALQELSEVKLAAARSQQSARTGERLIAYLQLEEGSPDLTLEGLRKKLKQSLPDYMLPTDLVLMDVLPFLPSGKVDRRSLPEIDKRRPAEGAELMDARNLLEQRLVGIWEKVLGFRPIGVRDSFFSLGGNSLSAMSLLSEIESELGEHLPVASLMQSSTVEQQALLLQTEQSARPSTRVVGIQTKGDLPPFFCVSPRNVDVLAYRNLAVTMGEEQPFYALYKADMPAQPTGIPKIVHEASVFIEEIRRIEPVGPYQVGGYSHGGIIALEIARQLEMQGDEVRLLVFLDVYGPNYRKMHPLLHPALYRPLQFLRRMQKSVEEFKPWFVHHFRILRQISWGNRVWYLQKKISNQLRWRRYRARNLIGRMQARPRSRSDPKRVIGRSFHDYIPEAYRGKVLLIRASRQPLGIQSDLKMGWEGYLTGDVRAVEVPGYHDSILFSPRLEAISGVLRQALAAGTGDDQQH